MIGTSLGPYKIIEQLGAGGMGEVYLGEDTRLGRKVAIKVLPAEFAADPERLARFEQEARAAAALNHPHIAVVHDVGSEPGEDGTPTHFMVQEYLEGQGLRERLDKGALPLDEALDLATEVGEALIVAHKAGIIHRDLKPDNIFVTEQGHAKVLDFGLAKLTELAAPTGSSASMSPTMLGTVAGQVMGTAGYMAPEQVNGEEVDHRADLFAFGAVLYEMVTGRRAFAGESIVQTLSKIAHEEPEPVSRIVETSPADLQRIVRKCLTKHPGRRYQHAEDVAVDLRQLQEDIASGLAGPVSAGQSLAAPVGVGASRTKPWKLAVPLAVFTLLIGVLGTWWATRPDPGLPWALEINVSELATGGSGGHLVAISPDGRHIVYVAGTGADSYLVHRRTDQFAGTPIRGTEGARRPFFSADGGQVGFHAGGSLKTVSLAGGEPFDLCDDCEGAGDWSPLGDTIIFSQGGPLWQIPAVGGEPVLLAEPDAEKNEVRYSRPEILPDGNAVLFEIRRGGTATENAGIAVLSLETMEVQIVAEEGTDPLYAESGHVIYASGNTLFSVAFDPRNLSVTGQPRRVRQGVRVERGGAAQFGISRDGTLVYVPDIGGTFAGFPLVWVDRDGEIEPLPFEPRDSVHVDLSPDGQRIAVQIGDDTGEANIWIYEAGRSGSQVLLTTEGNGETPVWSPDGIWVLFRSDRGGNNDIWRRRANQSGDAELVWDWEAPVTPASISSDATMLLFSSGVGVGLVNLDEELNAEGEPRLLAATDTFEAHPVFSPSDRFFAFTSAETGQFNVYVMDLEGGGKFPVSTSARGGRFPRWSRDGGEIYYFSLDTAPGLLVAEVDIEARRAFEPAEISDINSVPFINFAVDHGRQRFLVTTWPSDAEDATPRTPRINVILNWFEELKRLVPTDGSR